MRPDSAYVPCRQDTCPKEICTSRSGYLTNGCNCSVSMPAFSRQQKDSNAVEGAKRKRFPGIPESVGLWLVFFWLWR
eukprot:s5930_g9.t1